MYVCPVCEDRFELVVQAKVDGVATLTVVHNHEQDPPIWQAAAYAKGERKTPETREIVNKNLEAKKTATQKKAQEKRAEKVKGQKGWAKGPTQEERATKIWEYEEWLTAQGERVRRTRLKSSEP